MSSQSSQPCFSTNVSLLLHVCGQSLIASHVGEELIILRNPASIKPGPAVVEMIVDGESFRSDVRITGIEANNQRLIISNPNLVDTSLS